MGRKQNTNHGGDENFNPRSIQARLDGVKGKAIGKALAWSKCDQTSLVMAIDEVVNAGGTIQFGRTKSGRSLVLRVYEDGAAEPSYADTIDEADAYLAAIIAAI